jgi:RHS repeat-associated protein
VDQPLRWKARWWSEHSRLYDVRARQWSPEIGSFTSIDEFAYHRRRHTLWGWPGMSPIMWRDPWGRDYESTGLEGWFLRNADDMMEIAGGVAVAAGVFATGGLALAATDSFLVAGAASGAFGAAETEAVRQFRAGEPDDLCKLRDAALEGAFEGLVYAALEGAASGELGSDALVKSIRGLNNRGGIRIVSGVTVQPRGGPAMSGNVDLAPTLDRINAGGNFPHANDGAIFGNREGRLPAQPHGYYQEWVHPTPGVAGPGPQRIITGAGGEVYYTPDHYQSFIKVN